MLVHKEPQRFSGFPMLRSLMDWEPMRELAPLFEKEEREVLFVPTFDVKETKEAFLVKADLPGVAEKDIEVTISGHRLTVSGKREEEKKEKGDVFYTWERSFGMFTRSFKLPEGIDGYFAADHKTVVFITTLAVVAIMSVLAYLGHAADHARLHGARDDRRRRLLHRHADPAVHEPRRVRARRGQRRRGGRATTRPSPRATSRCTRAWSATTRTTRSAPSTTRSRSPSTSTGARTCRPSSRAAASAGASSPRCGRPASATPRSC